MKKKYTPKLKKLDIKFADMKVGQIMAIGTPDIIIDLTRLIPKGKKWSIKDLRLALALKLKADVACPVTTSMYFRIAIEESVKEGLSKKTPPFWRAVDIDGPIYKKLSDDAKEIVRNMTLKEQEN